MPIDLVDDSHHCPLGCNRYNCRGILSLQMPYLWDLLQVNREAKRKSVKMSILDINIEIFTLKLLTRSTLKICYIFIIIYYNLL